jgi:dihydrofolate synthase/folylpolyglutamate synthase
MRKTTDGYKSALRFILSRELFGMKLGLENISNLLNSLGHPEKKLAAIHIAGTNGKGSTAAYIDSILRKAGYKTGIFTSPHLVDFRERVRVNGDQINERYITSFIAKHRKEISKNKITFFELCTALAFNYFADRRVDIAIIETGLGGRLDATNTITPLVSIITDISYDHTHILGRTLKKIAYEKAGIIKRNVPALIGLMPPSAKKEIRQIAKLRKSKIHCLSEKNFRQNKQPFLFDYRHGLMKFSNLESSLPGVHQIRNSALSIRAMEILGEKGYKISNQAIRDGLKNAHWPGRFQILYKPDQPTVILDVGHNPGGFKAMTDCFKALYPKRKAKILIGMVSLKDLEKSLISVPSIAKQAIVAPLKTHRTANPLRIAKILKNRKIDVSLSKSIKSAARRMIDLSSPDDIIIICGSHYGVGEFIANQEKIYGDKKRK